MLMEVSTKATLSRVSSREEACTGGLPRLKVSHFQTIRSISAITTWVSGKMERCMERESSSIVKGTSSKEYSLTISTATFLKE
jgi:hypothetical protein